MSGYSQRKTGLTPPTPPLVIPPTVGSVSAHVGRAMWELHRAPFYLLSHVIGRNLHPPLRVMPGLTEPTDSLTRDLILPDGPT